jgi:hypothetical protein
MMPILAMACALFVAGVASAQSPNSLVGGSPFNPPPPPPPPGPKIEVPVVPKLDEPSKPLSQARPQPSFSERFGRCLDEAAASGFRPGERDAYARSCANR